MTKPLLLTSLLLLIALIPASQPASQGGSQVQEQAPSEAKRTNDAVPAYHSVPPAGPLPATLDAAQFSSSLVRNVYSMAANIKPVLYQQPCYCGCDRFAHHKSLLDCYVDTHATECEICQKECIYSYERAKKGASATEIRERIVRQAWDKISLDKYKKPLHLPN
jgi:hypothetical protein